MYVYAMESDRISKKVLFGELVEGRRGKGKPLKNCVLKTTGARPGPSPSKRPARKRNLSQDGPSK